MIPDTLHVEVNDVFCGKFTVDPNSSGIPSLPVQSWALFCPRCGQVWARMSPSQATRWHAIHTPCVACGGTGQILPHFTTHRVTSVSEALARYELRTFNRNHPGRDLFSAG